MQCWELANVSMQVVAATVRLRVSAEESRMHFAMDCTEVRLSEKRAMGPSSSQQ